MGKAANRHSPYARWMAWWRSPSVRRAREIWQPIAFVLIVGSALAAYPPTREAAVETVEAVRKAAIERPEFKLDYVALTGATHLDEKAVIEAMDFEATGRYALNFDVRAARSRVEALGWVEHASVSLVLPQTLRVDVIERQPVAVWRQGQDLALLDEDGTVITAIERRGAWAHLPLLLGSGAPEALTEARAVLRHTGDLGLPVVGLVRVGLRRWDVELLDAPRLMLPEFDTAADMARAFLRIARWQRAQRLLARDIDIVDMRFGAQPTVRLRQNQPQPQRTVAPVAAHSIGVDASPHLPWSAERPSRHPKRHARRATGERLAAAYQ